MYILIEEHQYQVSDIKDILHGLDVLEDIEGKVSIQYVGYFYNTNLKDCIFILPKVLVDNNELVFGKYKPEDIINIHESNLLTPEEGEFLYKFSIWIYRALIVYKQNRRNNSSIIFYSRIAEISSSKFQINNTYLDILLSLIQFNKENQSFFFTEIKNIHRGINRINWTRTIGESRAILQKGCPIYATPINKKRLIHLDEELLIIFYSILNYISASYGLTIQVGCQFQLITGKRFDTYLNGYGKTRLHQIKYKYFSDKALRLWQLCYTFFDESKQINTNIRKKEYLLAKDFYIVFEAIIDELIGDYPLPDGMDKHQEDGKIVDHLYTAQSLIENEEKQTYYIGDSKYYKIGHEIGKESIYKQYTYARNVIQWNLDIFNEIKAMKSEITLRDEETEGYNIIPNFFISASLDKKLSYTNEGIKQTERKQQRYKKFHFKNRLFDRDTLLLFHYDVNFLFVLSLYARNNANQKVNWKAKIRNLFRTEIQFWLNQDYEFYIMKAHPDVNASEYISLHFKSLIGKVYKPFCDRTLYVLALEVSSNDFLEENTFLKKEIEKKFYLKRFELGQKVYT